MQKIKKLQIAAEQAGVDLEILTYQDVMREYVDGEDIQSAEAFCGYDLEKNDILYWLVTDEPYFFVGRQGEDISDIQLENALMYLSVMHR